MTQNLLNNIEYIPVQRNLGIDAILKKTYQNSPVLIRIQRKHETLEEAVNKLQQAIEKKQSKKSFLIRTNDIESLFQHEINDNKINIVNSISYNLEKELQQNG